MFNSFKFIVVITSYIQSAYGSVPPVKLNLRLRTDENSKPDLTELANLWLENYMEKVESVSEPGHVCSEEYQRAIKGAICQFVRFSFGEISFNSEIRKLFQQALTVYEKCPHLDNDIREEIIEELETKDYQDKFEEIFPAEEIPIVDAETGVGLPDENSFFAEVGKRVSAETLEIFKRDMRTHVKTAIDILKSGHRCNTGYMSLLAVAIRTIISMRKLGIRLNPAVLGLFKRALAKYEKERFAIRKEIITFNEGLNEEDQRRFEKMFPAQAYSPDSDVLPSLTMGGTQGPQAPYAHSQTSVSESAEPRAGRVPSRDDDSAKRGHKVKAESVDGGESSVEQGQQDPLDSERAEHKKNLKKQEEANASKMLKICLSLGLTLPAAGVILTTVLVKMGYVTWTAAH